MLTEEQKRRADEHIRLAWYFAGKYRRRRQDLTEDEILSACFLGLTHAIKTWRPDGGCSVSAYVGLACRQMIDREQAGKRQLAARGVCLLGGALDDFTGQEDEHQGDDREHLAWLLRHTDLPERWREVLWWRYFDGMTLNEIAEKIGTTREWVRQLIEKALGRLRQSARLIR